jgi:hypothetical protein
MSKCAAVIPVWIQDCKELVDQTIKAASCLRTQHELTLYVACTRLHQVSPLELENRIQRACPFHVVVLHEACVERSVAGAWNWGVKHALDEKADYILIQANDVEVEPECVDRLVAYGEAHKDVLLWSGLESRQNPPEDPATVLECCDFSCFMIRPETIATAGWPDRLFRPAYAEDNDFYTRVVLSDGLTRQVATARFLHHGSLTIRSEPDAAHHVRHHFDINIERYKKKWGVGRVVDTPAEIREHCFKTPYNEPGKPVSWWPEQDKEGWSHFGGMHQ